jgi:type IV secretion system protein VirB11
MISAASSYLQLYLEPLASYLDRSDVTDIYINRPGEIWLEMLGGAIERREVPALDAASLWRLARQVASASSQGINTQHPLLAASLPGGARIQIAAPPATRGDMAIAIRRHAAMTVGLESYGPDAEHKAASPEGDSPDVNWLLAEHDYPTLLSWAVRSRKNILISGGTSSGKTTLLNSLLGEIPASERLIFIEDTPELRLSHANSVGLLAVRGRQGEARVTSEDLLQASLRMRPDRIILGELRGPEAFTYLRAINTGHPGSLTTIHADSPERAFVQLAMMALQAGVGLSYQDVRALVREMVDVVVQVRRISGRRRIVAMELGTTE